MSRIDPQQGLMPSLLDRLIDPEADGTNWQRGYSVQQMVSAVFRDLEELLNARQTTLQVPPECVETINSIVTFGMPDLTSIPAVTPAQRGQIGRLLETLIQRFEPRLRNIRATLLDPGQQLQRGQVSHRGADARGAGPGGGLRHHPRIDHRPFDHLANGRPT